MTALVTVGLVLAGLLTGLTALAGWRRRALPGARAFTVLAVSITIWCFAQATSYLLPTLNGKIAASTILYIGACGTPIAFVWAAVGYTGRPRWLSTRRLAALALMPVVTFGLVATNSLHHLHWAGARLETQNGLTDFAPDYGPWFYVHLGYSYLFLAMGGAIVIWTMLTSPGPYRRQALPLSGALFAPWLANVVYVSGFTGILDPTPFGFAITAMLLGVCIARFRLLDVFVGLIPAGRDAVVDLMSEGVILIDGSGRIADANRAAGELARVPASELVGREAADALGGWPAELRTAGGGERHGQFTSGKGADQRHLEYSAQPVATKSGAEAGLLVVLRDTTERARAEAAVRASEERYRALVENANDMVFTASACGTVTSLNRAGELMSGRPRAEVIGSPLVDLLMPNAAPGARQRFVADLLASGSIAMDIELTTPQGRRVSLEVRARSVDHGDGAPGIQGMARDVTERRLYEAQLAHRALHDPLTDLPNRSLLRDRLHEATRVAATADRTLALLLMDLDHFKDVNDTLGHTSGDLLLRQVGPRFRTVLREGDTIARVGGDEFAVLLPDSSPHEAAEVAERLLGVLDAPFSIVGRSVRAGASIGIAMFPKDATDADGLIRQADVAMYAAKRTRVGYLLYESRLEEGPADRLALADELREAVLRGEIELRYQPVLDLTDGSVPAVEALARWRHPVRGLLEPAEFIPLAERTGLISSVTRAVLAIALGDAAGWRARGVTPDIAVNLSAIDLSDAGLADEIVDATTAAGGSPDWLTIELTEGAVMQDVQAGQEALRSLRALGCSVLVDDFGTGYSSLAHLRTLPVNGLKIDRSFVQGLVDDPSDRAIVRAVIGLGKEMHLTVVAEGVETTEVLRALIAEGCTLAQGRLLGEPMTADAFLDFCECVPRDCPPERQSATAPDERGAPARG